VTVTGLDCCEKTISFDAAQPLGTQVNAASVSPGLPFVLLTE
jgi:hypothetical protein